MWPAPPLRLMSQHTRRLRRHTSDARRGLGKPGKGKGVTPPWPAVGDAAATDVAAHEARRGRLSGDARQPLGWRRARSAACDAPPSPRALPGCKGAGSCSICRRPVTRRRRLVCDAKSVYAHAVCPPCLRNNPWRRLVCDAAHLTTWRTSRRTAPRPTASNAPRLAPRLGSES